MHETVITKTFPKVDFGPETISYETIRFCAYLFGDIEFSYFFPDQSSNTPACCTNSNTDA